AVELVGADPQVARAVTTARDAVTAEPTSAAAWGRLGMVLFAPGVSAETVLACFARPQELDPAEGRWPYDQSGLLAFERPAEAVEPLRRAAQRSRRDPLPRLRLAEALYALDRLDEAESQFRQVGAGGDNEARVTLGLGQIALRRGDLKV